MFWERTRIRLPLYVPTKIKGQLIRLIQFLELPSGFFQHFQIAHVMTGVTAPIQKKWRSPE